MIEATARANAIWMQQAKRPRDRFVRASLLALCLLMAGAWGVGEYDWRDFASPRRIANFERFLEEARPYPLQGRAWDWGVAFDWSRELFADKGAEAMATTLAISILAILAAAGLGLLFSLSAARNFARPAPFARQRTSAPMSVRLAWRALRFASRSLLLVMRAMPEYMLAFLLLGLWGPSPWTAIAALALHNAGILGRLGAESIENVPADVPRSLRELGAARTQIATWSLMPELLPRLLLYLFYRWETCVREATVLGLLGIVSLGFWIDDARTRGQMDAMIYFVLLGVLIIWIGDWASGLARALLRRAS